jgi:hypothetical protein
MVGKHVLTGERRRASALSKVIKPARASPPGFEHPQLGEMTSGRRDKHYS